MNLGMRVLVITLVSLAVGVAGGFVGIYLTAPFYFGFFLGLTLAGMIGMFALAAMIETEREKNRRQ